MGSLRQHQKGFALAMLLWLIAAMSLLVAGVVYTAKMDVRQVQFVSAKSQAKAILDGAILKSMAEFETSKKQGDYQGRGIYYSEQVVGEQNVMVRLLPATGLIALTAASKPLWVELLVVAAGLELVEAELLADNILAWQKPLSSNNSGVSAQYQNLGLPEPRQGAFLAVEDLLAVIGVTGETFHSIKDLVYVSGAVGIDPIAAPAGVLRVLAGGNQSVVDEYLKLRNELPVNEVLPHAQMNQEFVASGNGSLLRVDARMRSADGKVFQRRVWVDTAKQAYGLPWGIRKVESIAIMSNLDFSGYSAQHDAR